jgi:hypothetical protein
MDHCHKLPHAADGPAAHLAYTGITTRFLIGGEASNEPEGDLRKRTRIAAGRVLQVPDALLRVHLDVAAPGPAPEVVLLVILQHPS